MKFPKLVKGRMRLIPYWPLFLIPIIILLAVLVYLNNREAGIITLMFLCVYIGFSLGWMLIWRKHLVREITALYENFDKTQNQQLKAIPMPYAIIDNEGYLLWENNAFSALIGENVPATRIDAIIPELAEMVGARENLSKDVKIKNKIFNVELTYVESGEEISSLSFFDISEQVKYQKLSEERKSVVAQISVDNYEEAIASTEIVRRPLLAALIERKINKYFSLYDGIVSKTDKDKFTVFLSNKGYKKILENKFSVLEDIKTLNIGNDVRPTISIGIGMNGETISGNSQYAVMALDLCLGRGGDQAVVKTPEGSEFFGGKVEHTDRSTKVKARIMAQALKEVFLSKQNIIILGHKMPDADSLGASIGIYRIARNLDKNAHIIFGSVSSGIRGMYERLRNDGDFPENTFITGQEALMMLDPQTLVVLVDVNRPSYSECPDLLNVAKNVVVIDHHRQSEDSVVGPVLSYIEPNASSASELVAEIIQYISDSLKPTPIEAEALYGGIVIDTDNFLTKTGTRTFEAAAYLRRCGADMARVRKLFRDNMEDFKAKARTISQVEIYKEAFAIGRCLTPSLESPMIIGAQASNELLAINGIKASFVFTPVEDKIYISARSIDEVNVQLIMERLGGGGHLSVAGAQLRCDLEDAIEKTKEIIDQMIEEGAI